jgi:hypothetical protein
MSDTNVALPNPPLQLTTALPRFARAGGRR